MRRSYYRTVKNNQVRILGKTLGNDDLKNGELDGVRCLFRLYTIGGEWLDDCLTALWGTEAYAKEFLTYKEDCEILAPDGFLYWYFWKEIKRIKL